MDPGTSLDFDAQRIQDEDDDELLREEEEQAKEVRSILDYPSPLIRFFFRSTWWTENLLRVSWGLKA